MESNKNPQAVSESFYEREIVAGDITNSSQIIALC